MKKKRTIVRITYGKDKFWGVFVDKFMYGFFDTKKEAIALGRRQAKICKPSQLVIHLKNGRIQTEHTYGQDPERSKG